MMNALCVYLLRQEEKIGRKRQRAEIRDFAIAMELPDEEFLENYKVGKEMVEYLCEELEDNLAPRTADGLPVLIKAKEEAFGRMVALLTMSTTTSPKSSLAKLVLGPKPKTFKVMVLGQSGVGKSALVVRFITRRFIGEYDPTLEKVYTFQTVIDNEMVYFEILDSAGDSHESEYANLESNIRWAEAFILMYSVTDKCSFDECHRLKFLINYNKRRRRLTATKDSILETPVVLVGNKTDQGGDRMVTTEEGQRRSQEIGCVCFHEISVRESIDQVVSVFRDTRRFWRVSNKWPRARAEAAAADVHPAALVRPIARAASDSPEDTVTCSKTGIPFCRRWTEVDLDEEEESSVARSDSTSSSGRSEGGEEFRARASTDSRLPPRPARPRHPHPARTHPAPLRRMSVAMRGNNASSY